MSRSAPLAIRLARLVAGEAAPGAGEGEVAGEGTASAPGVRVLLGLGVRFAEAQAKFLNHSQCTMRALHSRW